MKPLCESPPPHKGATLFEQGRSMSYHVHYSLPISCDSSVLLSTVGSSMGETENSALRVLHGKKADCDAVRNSPVPISTKLSIVFCLLHYEI